MSKLRNNTLTPRLEVPAKRLVSAFHSLVFADLMSN
jgi:hypothetical protein